MGRVGLGGVLGDIMRMSGIREMTRGGIEDGITLVSYVWDWMNIWVMDMYGIMIAFYVSRPGCWTIWMIAMQDLIY